MIGDKEPQKSTDEMCPHCGLYFSRRGIIPHRRNCEREEPILPVDRHDDGGNPPSDGEEAEGSDPPDDVGDAPNPDGSTPSNRSARTDGLGLGLEGPPETTTDVDDDVQDDTECCDDPDRRALNPGTKITLEDKTTVRAEQGDELCDACGALIEADGRIRR